MRPLLLLQGMLLALSCMGVAEDYFNHAQHLLGNMVTDRADVLHPEEALAKGNFVLVNQCNYDLYIR